MCDSVNVGWRTGAAVVGLVQWGYSGDVYGLVGTVDRNSPRNEALWGPCLGDGGPYCLGGGSQENHLLPEGSSMVKKGYAYTIWEFHYMAVLSFTSAVFYHDANEQY